MEGLVLVMLVWREAVDEDIGHERLELKLDFLDDVTRGSQRRL